MSRIIKFLKKYNIIIASLIIMLALFFMAIGYPTKNVLCLCICFVHIFIGCYLLSL